MDPLNRQLVRRFVGMIIRRGETQLLYSFPIMQDAPACITHRRNLYQGANVIEHVSDDAMN
ncbi:hypothetical protein KCP75_02910 [Salmonella enterica subsp. enterica]|nr:hypothetical protein KCP75_02910 [Salmonella enterica subsp. enterica]